jgi:OmpA family protein/thrombospondin type 3 repeat protein
VPAKRLLGEKQLVVDGDLKYTTGRRNQLHVDAWNPVPQLSRQTDGSRLVVSNDAVFDANTHERRLSCMSDPLRRIVAILFRAAKPAPCQSALRGVSIETMRTYLQRVLLAAGAILIVATPASAQRRRYLLELSAGGTYMSFDNATNLHGAFGGAARLGLWLPLNLSIEGEALITRPSTTVNGFGWNARFFSGSLLENISIGSASSFFIRAGYGTSKYDSDRCDIGVSFVDIGPCGSTPVLLGGLGFRMAISPTIMIRVDGAVNHSTSTSLTNFGGSAGLSLMLGSKSATDVDHDGVYDTEDRCAGTPRGVLVDRRGCPTDTDKDGVPDGLDRCPTSAPGTQVDAAGCPRDTDRDAVPDGIDRCANTPIGATVDSAGCPVDSDKDGVADGLDRCPDTPAGASVDQLGCPGDEDNDGVLDGLDKCPHTPPGQTVNAFGCPPTAALPESAGPDRRSGQGTLDGPMVLRGVSFASGSARLQPQSYPVLDSLARALLANPGLSVEIGGHTDNVGNPASNLHLSRLRAEAVRRYLISRKVPFTRMVAKGYGSTQPISTEPTEAARATNRRVEVKPLPPPGR